MTGKFARRATLATGPPLKDGVLEEPRRGFVGWQERLLVTAQAPFYVGSRMSSRARLWVLAYQALTLPLSLWRQVHHFRATVQGTAIPVVCVGRYKRFRDLLTGLFDGVEPDGTVERIGDAKPRWAWRPRRLRALGASLLIVDLHPWLAAPYRREGWRLVPESVRWQGDVERLPPPRPAETLRSDMRKVDRYGYRREESAGDAEWAEFLEQMALPYAHARFGEEVWFPDRRMLRHLRKRGRLLFVNRDDMRVAGGCVVSTPSCLWLSLVGTKNGDERWVREGALSAVYLLTFDWARQQGYRRLDVGTTWPFPNDGLARYKAKLGLAPAPNPLAFTNALYVDPECASLAALFSEQPLFCVAKDGIELFPQRDGGLDGSRPRGEGASG